MNRKDNEFPDKSINADDTGVSRESEARYRHFIENLSVMFYAAAPHPPYAPIYISPAFEQLGYPLEEWRGGVDLWMRVLHADDREWVLTQTEAARQAGEETDFEYRIVAQDGTVRWVRDRGSFIRDARGETIYWQGIILDITTLKSTEQELRALFEAVNDVIFVFDKNGRYLKIAPTNPSLLCRPLEELVGATLADTFPADQAAGLLGFVRAALQKKQTQQFEYMLPIDGREVWFSATVSPMTADAVIFVARDITESKQAEKFLKESEARYRDLFENANDLVYVHDLQGNYLSVNRAAESLFGYTREEALEMNIAQITAPEHLEYARQMLAKKIAGAGQTAYEVECLTKSGDRLILEVNSTAIEKDGVPIAVQGIARDVTERKQTQYALQRSEAEMQAIFSAMTDVIMVLDAEGDSITFARTNQKLSFKPSLDLAGKKLNEIFPESLAEYFSDNVRRSLQTNQAVQMEYCVQTGDEEHWFAAVISPLMTDSAVVVARDISAGKRTEKALIDREKQYRELFENANDLIYTHDLAGNFTSLNRAGEVITGYRREEMLRMNIAQVVAPDHLEEARRMIVAKDSGDAPTAYELEIITKSNSRVSLELSARLIVQNGVPVGVQGIGRDITERKRAEERLKVSERRYRSLGEGIMHHVWTAQPDGRLDYVNSRTLEYISQTSEQALDDGWQSVVYPDDLPEAIERWTHSLETGDNYETEFRLRRYDGKYRWHQARATAEFDADGKIVSWFGTNTDIDDRKIAEAKLNHFAGHDTLTNLPNRAKFMNHLSRAVSRSQHNPAFRFAVLFLDLDRFKIINDSLGHITGDKLLIAFAQRLEECVRPNDIVARLGGDEFTILLSSINEPVDAVRAADRILEKLSVPFILDAYEVFTSASIGIIVSDEIDREPEDFLRDADTAMYRAKEAGKSRYEIFDREMHIRNINLLQLENDLRRAIEQNEFKVFYQPIVELATGEIRELEALIRWQHPARGLIAPNDFISIAEETGLIIRVGEWILREACRQTAEWQRTIPSMNELSVSVNLSAKQLTHPHLTAQVGEILAQTQLKPRYLKLEVTESMVMENSEKALAIISDLRALGTAVSTDDFGTGYSSLSYLHRFPFNRLKIDRSFVSKMDADQKSEAIVRTILLLAQNLDIEAVAEGIETERQLEILRLLSCKTGQGYLFSKPVSAEAAAQLLRDGLPVDFKQSNFSFRETGESQVLEVDKIQ